MTRLAGASPAPEESLPLPGLVDNLAPEAPPHLGDNKKKKGRGKEEKIPRIFEFVYYNLCSIILVGKQLRTSSRLISRLCVDPVRSLPHMEAFSFPPERRPLHKSAFQDLNISTP